MREHRLIGYNSNPAGGVGSTVDSSEIEDGSIVDGDINASANITGTKVAAATDTGRGTVELATDAETITGTDTARAVTPANIQAKVASDTAKGIVELAIASEINTGTDATRAMTPDAYAGSLLGYRVIEVVVFDSGTDVTTGDGKAYVTIPSNMAGMNLVRAQATVVTAGTTNATTVMIHNLTDTVDMLSGAISIASAGVAGTVGTINTSTDDVTTNDRIRIDVDSVSTTAPKGLTVIMEFQLP